MEDVKSGFAAVSSAEAARPFAATLIIPTYNRLDALRLCLAHLERQSRKDFEIVLVDDGSSDGTSEWLAEYSARVQLALRVFRQPNAGPARARNLAVAHAASPLCIIIGDDILCSPEFVEVHVRFHAEHPEEHVAALGLTRWSETGQKVTPFMRWMDESGAQFNYGELLRGTTPNWKFFYTSNLSLKTELLRRHPFSEEFPFANMEDMELGYRLEVKEGLRVAFLPEARAEHLHPIDFEKACVRAWRTGLSLQVFDRLWPDRPQPVHGAARKRLKDFLCWNAWALRPMRGLTGRLTRVWCPNPLLEFTLAFHTEVARRSGGSMRNLAPGA